MKTATEVEINQPLAAVWALVIDIEHSANVISAINDIEVVDKGNDNKVGFKWRETRTMMGKDATETMWISEILPESYYVVLAESHGTKYRSTIEVAAINASTTKLKMTFSGEPTTLVSKILSKLMMPFFKGSITKMLHQDLLDIKHHLENIQ